MSRKEKPMGTRVDDETRGLVADAVIALSGPPWRMTKKKFVAGALLHFLQRLQDLHNDGKPFPVAEDRRLVPGAGSDEQSARVGKRKSKGVAGKSRARARPRKKRKSHAPARSRRRRKR